LCPLSNQSTIADFAVRVGFPVLIVARLGLGTINHTLLTLEAAERRGLDVRGIVFNESEPGNNAEAAATDPLEVARRTSVPVLGVIRHGSTELVRFDRSHFAKPAATLVPASSDAAAATASAPTSLLSLSTAQEVDFARDLSQSQLHEAEKGITINWLQLLG